MKILSKLLFLILPTAPIRSLILTPISTEQIIKTSISSPRPQINRRNKNYKKSTEFERIKASLFFVYFILDLSSWQGSWRSFDFIARIYGLLGFQFSHCLNLLGVLLCYWFATSELVLLNFDVFISTFAWRLLFLDVRNIVLPEKVLVFISLIFLLIY